MQLKFKYSTREEIPAEQQEFYIERDGAWYADVQGAVDAEASEQRATELAAERNALTGECDALRARIEELQRVNQGAGAPGAADEARQGRFNNPFRRESFNLTRQGDVWKRDPAKAKALKQAAQ
jgi:hypothetical protein